MTLWFKIDFHTGKPIYEQIKEKIKDFIVDSVLKFGDPIPSVRELAKMLKVNVNTVVKAYKELEVEGIIISKKGIGYFVNVDEVKIKQILLEDLKRRIYPLMMKLKKLGLSKDEIISMVEDIQKDEEYRR